MATDMNSGKTPSAAQQLEASNAMMHAQAAVQAAEAQMRAATHAAERMQAQKAVQAAGAEMDKVKEKFGWILDWQKASQGLHVAGDSPAGALGTVAAAAEQVTVAQAEAMLRDAKTAEERVRAQTAMRMATAQATKPEAAVEQAGHVQAALGSTTAQVRKHIVQKGESLSLIAKHYYGDIHKWKQLYEANKAVVGGNPDLIQPGMELVIP